MAHATAKDKAEPEGNPLDEAADRLRESAKWLVAAFGAVAAVIFAGLTVADLGGLDGETPGYRLQIALGGAGAAIIGIVGALAQAMRLAGASTTSLEDLTRKPKVWELSLKETQDELTSDAALTTWGGDVNALIDDYRAAYDEYVQRAEAYAGDIRKKQPDQSRLNQAFYRLRVMSGIVHRLLSTASFLRLQRSFARARRAIAFLIMVSAAGAVAFGWATTSLPDEPPEISTRLIAATLRPDEDVVKDLNRQMSSKACHVEVGEAVRVVVLGDSEEKALRIATIPATNCQPATASVPDAQVTKE